MIRDFLFIKLFLAGVILTMYTPITVHAHPGNTDSSGGHTCRTNCSSWGRSHGEYHTHGGGSVFSNSPDEFSIRSYDTIESPFYAQPTSPFGSGVSSFDLDLDSDDEYEYVEYVVPRTTSATRENTKQIQRMLNLVIVSELDVDGGWDIGVRDAIKDFQGANGITASGSFDMETAGELSHQFARLVEASEISRDLPILEGVERDFDYPYQIVEKAQKDEYYLVSGIHAPDDGIRELQIALNKIMGTDIYTDGLWGRQTTDTLRDFQARYGFNTDGLLVEENIEEMSRQWDLLQGNFDLAISPTVPSDVPPATETETQRSPWLLMVIAVVIGSYIVVLITFPLVSGAVHIIAAFGKELGL